MEEVAAIAHKADDALHCISDSENSIYFSFPKMWYGCVPSMTIIIVAMSLPHILIYFEHKYILGNPYKRYLSNKFECHTYLRDMRLGNGDPYKQLGLDTLSPGTDEECKCA